MCFVCDLNFFFFIFFESFLDCLHSYFVILYRLRVSLLNLRACASLGHLEVHSARGLEDFVRTALCTRSKALHVRTLVREALLDVQLALVETEELCVRRGGHQATLHRLAGTVRHELQEHQALLVAPSTQLVDDTAHLEDAHFQVLQRALAADAVRCHR